MKKKLIFRDTLIQLDGTKIHVKLDVQARFVELNRALNEATKAAQDAVTAPDAPDRLQAFYEHEYRHFLECIIGADNFAKALQGYDGHVDVLCKQLDSWAAVKVTPLIFEASRRELKRRQREARRALRRRK